MASVNANCQQLAAIGCPKQQNHSLIRFYSFTSLKSITLIPHGIAVYSQVQSMPVIFLVSVCMQICHK